MVLSTPHLPHSPSPILSPRPGVYTVNLYIVFFHLISAVLCTWELHWTSSAPNALHEHSTTVHAVYFFSGFPVQSLISLHRHLFFISISPLSFFLPTNLFRYFFSVPATSDSNFSWAFSFLLILYHGFFLSLSNIHIMEHTFHFLQACL